MVRPQRQPGRAGGKTQIGRARIPGHGRAAAVAALEQRIIEIAHRVLELVARADRLPAGPAPRPDRAATCRARPHSSASITLALPAPKRRGGADHVMVGKGDAGPVIGKARQGFQMGADRGRIGRQQQREIVAGMQALCPAADSSRSVRTPPRIRRRRSGRRKRPPGGGSHPARRCSLPDWSRADAAACWRRPTIPRRRARRPEWPDYRVSLRVVQKGVGDIQAKAVHAALQPQIQHLQRRLARLPDSSSSAWAAGAGICGDSIAAAPADRTRPGRRTPTASCWAPCRRPSDRPRHTSPFLRHRHRGWRRTRHARRRYAPALRPG